MSRPCTAVGLLALAHLAYADTVIVEPSRDNTLIEQSNQGAGPWSNGQGVRFFAGDTLQFGSRRCLVRFDLSTIPAGALVTAAAVTLQMEQTRAGPVAVALHRVLADWGEGASNSFGGGGAPAQTGDATWQHRFYSLSSPLFWSTPGGDFVPISSASTTVGNPGTYVWASTAQLVADVQAWIQAPASNFGWIVIGDESTRSVKAFTSRHATGEQAANRPKLAVTFNPPLPVDSEVPTLPQWGLIAMSVLLLGAAARLRRRQFTSR